MSSLANTGQCAGLRAVMPAPAGAAEPRAKLASPEYLWFYHGPGQAGLPGSAQHRSLRSCTGKWAEKMIYTRRATLCIAHTEDRRNGSHVAGSSPMPSMASVEARVARAPVGARGGLWPSEATRMVVVTGAGAIAPRAADSAHRPRRTLFNIRPRIAVRAAVSSRRPRWPWPPSSPMKGWAYGLVRGRR